MLTEDSGCFPLPGFVGLLVLETLFMNLKLTIFYGAWFIKVFLYMNSFGILAFPPWPAPFSPAQSLFYIYSIFSHICKLLALN